MSKPSFSNIELWLFELAEGNLSPQQVEQLELFLLQHPDIDVDRDVWEMAKVNNEPVVFPGAEAMKKEAPIGAFYIASSLALVLLAFTWGYGYFTNPMNAQSDVLIAENSDDNNAEVTRLKQQIHQLQSIVHSLELELSDDSNQERTSETAITLGNNTDESNTTETLTSVAHQLLNGAVNPSEVSNTGFSEVVPSETNHFVTNPTPGVVLTGGLVEQVNEVPNSEARDDMASMSPIGVLPLEFQFDNFHLEPLSPHLVQSSDDPERTFNHENSALEAHTRFENTGHELTFKNRLGKFTRSVTRMLDNPVALKNTRDPHYHVPGMTSQDVNFGSVGTLIAPRVQTMSRLQWLNQSNEQMMNQLSLDGYAYGMRGGVGIQLNHGMYNRYGGVNVADVSFTYSPKISINRKVSIEPAFRFKMGNKRLDDSRMQGVTQVEVDRGNVHDYYPNGEVPVGRSLWYKDLGMGLNVNTRWFFASVQADNLFRYKDNMFSTDLENQHRAGTHFVAAVGTDWENRKENMSLSPYLVYQKKEQLSEAWLGVNYKWEWFTLGGALSSNMDPAASIGMKFDHFALTYNADYTFSEMTNTRALSHQVSIRFLGSHRYGKRLLNL